MMGDTVQQCGGHFGIAEDLRPFPDDYKAREKEDRARNKFADQCGLPWLSDHQPEGMKIMNHSPMTDGEYAISREERAQHLCPCCQNTEKVFELASGIGPLVRVGKTLAAYTFGILNWYDHPISSGPMEGTNNKIKTMKRMAYGYRDLAFFKLRILAIHEAKYALAG